MNLFSQSNNTCLWLLLLLFLAMYCGNNLSNILNGGCTPFLIALIVTMWQNGTLSKIFCGYRNGNCGCNG